MLTKTPNLSIVIPQKEDTPEPKPGGKHYKRSTGMSNKPSNGSNQPSNEPDLNKPANTQNPIRDIKSTVATINNQKDTLSNQVDNNSNQNPTREIKSTVDTKSKTLINHARNSSQEGIKQDVVKITAPIGESRIHNTRGKKSRDKNEK